MSFMQGMWDSLKELTEKTAEELGVSKAMQEEVGFIEAKLKSSGADLQAIQNIMTLIYFRLGFVAGSKTVIEGRMDAGELSLQHADGDGEENLH